MSLRGLDRFRQFFADHKDQYVLIGGGACDLLFAEAEADFRATKDLDLVLIVEALTPDFGRTFWRFVEEGGYEHKARSGGAPQFYRFSKPKDGSFPFMLELFGRSSMVLKNQAAELTPIHVDDEVSSLSAILLDEDYYELLKSNRREVEGITVLSAESLIPFKAKAWLDLTERKAGGVHVDDKDIKKHRNDVCRLAGLLTGDESVRLPDGVRRDMRKFLKAYREHPVDPKALKLKGVKAEQIVDVLQAVYDDRRRLPE